jgi:ribosomal protein S18 acetylase RimI-like enzyme
MQILQATSPAHIQIARELFREYSAWLEIDVCFQDFERELANLPGDYAPPAGRLLLAFDDDNATAGYIALRPLGNDICEMKRLFVRPSFRGAGLGRQLADRILAEARDIGYTKMRLDTIPEKMGRAIAMYRSLGFKEIDRYYDNPFDGAIFMEVEL